MVVVSFILVATVFWALFCNNKTLKQRLKILNTDPERYHKIPKVSYEKHLFHLLTCRNPYNLYK
jgi:hypothetical protein